MVALQLRNLQSLVEIGVDQNTMVVFPAPLMSTIHKLGAFLARDTTSASAPGTASDAAPAVEVPIRGSGSNGGPAAAHR